ncbi:MAG TPA: helix-hairpin-helix domain-containing protein [Candidatus Bathyarchaeia archaeon]|nr:helix-hairpin-helix domain-containing protein [Candidatus Bathyarchaeia archaeon]
MDPEDFSFTREEEGKEDKSKFALENFIAKNKLSLILGFIGVSFLIIGTLSTLILTSKKQSSNIEIIPSEEEQISEIYVHISGAVQRPGLYKLSSGARVNDVLVAAGGLASDANRQWFEKTVNLAQKLTDGVKLFIPFEGSDPVQGQTITQEQTSIFSQDSQGKVNINTASLNELDSLPGLGPVYAQRIIDYRNTHGFFSKVEDLINIPGIGEKTLEKFKDQITAF